MYYIICSDPNGLSGWQNHLQHKLWSYRSYLIERDSGICFKLSPCSRRWKVFRIWHSEYDRTSSIISSSKIASSCKDDLFLTKRNAPENFSVKRALSSCLSFGTKSPLEAFTLKRAHFTETKPPEAGTTIWMIALQKHLWNCEKLGEKALDSFGYVRSSIFLYTP